MLSILIIPIFLPIILNIILFYQIFILLTVGVYTCCRAGTIKLLPKGIEKFAEMEIWCFKKIMVCLLIVFIVICTVIEILISFALALGLSVLLTLILTIPAYMLHFYTLFKVYKQWQIAKIVNVSC